MASGSYFRSFSQLSSPNPAGRAPTNASGVPNARPLSASDLGGFGISLAPPFKRFVRANPEVGFASIVNQIYRKAFLQGFKFNLMVAGGSGLGKSTFLNSLFMTNFDTVPATPYRDRSSDDAQDDAVTEKTVTMVENGVSLILTIVETPGFGDALDSRQCLHSVGTFLDEQFWKYHSDERAIDRKPVIPDGRVHCCLYFISPNGQGLKPLDIEFMKKVHHRVNIIPILAKADSVTPRETAALKKAITDQILEAGIKVYTFPSDGPPKGTPFAVVSGDTIREIDGKVVRGREYPWGFVQVENPEHNDFVLLRDLLIRKHMIDLIDVTHNVHYENFRFFIIEGLDKLKKDDDERNKLFDAMAESKEDQLRQIEQQATIQNANLRSKLQERRRKLEEKRTQLQDDKEKFNAQYPDFSDGGNALTPNYGVAGHSGSFSSNSGKKSKSSTSLGNVFRSYTKSPTE